ncbi:low temperature requirement protein A [Streptomyces flavidovirens]|uniref:low temperature requirement protein A n=1 Tax=Streptomyces flavidovirens TaxID=67298 RepID=UPI00341F6515
MPPTTDRRRILLFAGMAGFLTMALALPEAFKDGEGAKVFAAGYALVTVVHAGLFSRATSAEASRAITRLAPFNLTGAALLVLGAFTHGRTQYALWLAALVIEAAAPRLGGRLAGFTFRPAHFVERHELIIIALGESLIAIAIAIAIALGAAGLPVNAPLIAVSVATLGIAACLWWMYFRSDIERAEQALAYECATHRAAVALNAYNYAHIPLLLGVVTFAAGVKKAAAHPLEPASTAGALFVAAGIALYLCGHAVFRRTLHLGGPWSASPPRPQSWPPYPSRCTALHWRNWVPCSSCCACAPPWTCESRVRSRSFPPPSVASSWTDRHRSSRSASRSPGSARPGRCW